jgi:sterol desaturase/sphingolipid hydroxylase (fatty acid hydroxylase superfamily)
LFHGFGKSGSSIFAFHLRSHHSIARSNGFLDARVSRNELFGLPIAVLLHGPLLLIQPVFFCTVAMYAFLFIVVHNALHRYPRIAQRYFWWHWNHHMGNQNKSWGVVLPLTDILVGTLEANTKNRRG